MSFARAIVRPPGHNFAAGLTTAAAGSPDLGKAEQQHERYCDALRRCGLELSRLEPDPAHPDGTFVEDAAVVTARGAILTRPGAPTRTAEIDGIGRALRPFFPDMLHIAAPGTVDGGDVCEADGQFLIGISARTNAAGAAQLARHLRQWDYSTSVVDIRANKALLHLKTGMAYLGDGVWVAAADIEREPGFSDFGIRDLITVSPEEAYAANCVRVNESVLVPAGYPRVTAALRDRGFRTELLDMSEFKRMDGGLSCLSLRF